MHKTSSHPQTWAWLQKSAMDTTLINYHGAGWQSWLMAGAKYSRGKTAPDSHRLVSWHMSSIWPAHSPYCNRFLQMCQEHIQALSYAMAVLVLSSFFPAQDTCLWCRHIGLFDGGSYMRCSPYGHYINTDNFLRRPCPKRTVDKSKTDS